MAGLRVNTLLGVLFVLGFILCLVIQFSPHGFLNQFEQLSELQSQLKASSPDQFRHNIADKFQSIYDAGSAALGDLGIAAGSEGETLSVPVRQSSASTHQVKSPAKIAYVFAGSARSFACPKVHWSIKAHLIDALGGDPHVFVRMSMEDNVNVKTGLGILKEIKYDEDVNNLLKVLNPKKVEFFSFSNQSVDMQRLHPEPIHTVFRENDLRRYSMFFHRCQAYKLAMEYEKENNMRFDWVVLVRVDAAWLEPILPIDAYMNDRVWVTETGYDVFNDQFMLIPRQFSDYLYDFNTKVNKNVYCLGGPDVETWKCSAEEMKKRSYSAEKIAQNLEHCCPDLLAGKPNLMGMSEAIHKRHLVHGKIPLSMGRFPVFLTRRLEINGKMMCHPECFRIYALTYKEYIYVSGNMTNVYSYMSTPEFPDTRGIGISSRDRVLCYYYVRDEAYPWQPVSVASAELARTSSNTPLTLAAPPAAQSELVPRDANGRVISSNSASLYHIDFSKKLTDPSQRLHPSILQNPKDTEVWRIHPTYNTEGCLTFSFKTKDLHWERCYDHTKMKRLRYDSRQLFFLYVLPTPPKHLDFPSYHAPVQFPESTYSTNVGDETRVLIVDSSESVWDFQNQLYCLTVESARLTARVYMDKCSSNVRDPKQLFASVRTQMDGSNRLSTVGVLQLASNPALCVSRAENGKTTSTPYKYMRERFPDDEGLFLVKCELRGSLHRTNFEFELATS